MFIPLNPIALFSAALVSFAIGFLWYSPYLFGIEWMKLMKLTPKKLQNQKKEKNMNLMFVSSFVATLVQALILAHVVTYTVNFYSERSLWIGAMTGFWVWLGFITVTQLNGIFYRNDKPRLFLIETGHQLVSAVIMAVILTMMV